MIAIRCIITYNERYLMKTLKTSSFDFYKAATTIKLIALVALLIVSAYGVGTFTSYARYQMSCNAQIMTQGIVGGQPVNILVNICDFKKAPQTPQLP